jgi:hypothetical protein
LSRMRLLAAAWRDTAVGVRSLCLILWSLGVLATVAGLWGDNTGWWDRHSFLANLASSSTGALFGVPFALVVIGYIAARQGDERVRREVVQQAVALARELESDAGALLRDSPEQVGALGVALRQAREALERSARGEVADTRAVMAAYTLWPEVISPRPNTQRLFDRMRHMWGSLKDDARPRLVRVNAVWLDRELVELLDAILSDVPIDATAWYWMDEMSSAGELTDELLRSRRGAEVHLRRITQAEHHLRTVERLGRYTQEVARHLSEQVWGIGATARG